jgi:hypothetical protein
LVNDTIQEPEPEVEETLNQLRQKNINLRNLEYIPSVIKKNMEFGGDRFDQSDSSENFTDHGYCR